MPSGTQIVDFGPFPGSPEASVDVSGQSGLVSTSRIEAWVQPIATADHSVSEHQIENIRVIATYKTDGTFTINAYVEPFWQTRRIGSFSGYNADTGIPQRHRLHGKFTIGWAWA